MKSSPTGRLALFAMTVTGVLLSAALRAGRPVLDTPDGGREPGGAVLAFARASDGCMVAGCAEGLTVFDGAQWSDVATPGGAHSFRSLAPDAGSGRVYVGGVGALGYLEQDARGAWNFVSLMPALRARDAAAPDKLGEVWHAHAEKGGAVFVSDNRVLRWTDTNGTGTSGHGGVFRVWEVSAAHRLHAFSLRDELIVQQEGTGLLRFAREGPEPWIPESDLPVKAPLVAVVPGGSAAGEPGGREMFVFADRVFVREGGANWVELPALSALLKNCYSVAACDAGGGRVAIGSFLGGVMLVDFDGRVIATANEAGGLANDNVHALWSDGAGTVWIGTASGMTRWRGAGAVSQFALSGQTSAVRKLVAQGDGVFLLTARGLFSESGHDFERVARAPGLWWDAADIGGNLWMAGFGGLWRWDEKGKRLVIEHNVSADVFCLGATGAADGNFVFVENETVKIFEQGPWGWVPRNADARLDSAPVSMVSEDLPRSGGRTGRRFWISTLGGEIWVLAREDAGKGLRVVTRMRAGAGLPAGATKPRLFRSAGRIVIFGGGGIFAQGEEAALTFKAVESLRDFSGVAATGGMRGDDNTGCWIVRRRGNDAQWPAALIRVERDKDEWKWTPLRMAGLDEIGPVADAVTAGGGALWIAGQNGVLRLDTGAAREAAPPPPPGAIRETRETADGPRSYYFPAARGAAAGERIFYQTQLRDAEPAWSPPSDSPERSIPRLAPGDYVFAARVTDRFGQGGGEITSAFAVPSPWHRTWPAFAFYGACGAAAIFGIFQWRTARLRRQNEHLNALVDERTRELSLSNTARSEFLDNISHEIRNPLEGIVGLVALMDKDATRERTMELAHSLKACAQNLEQVFDDVLGISKIEYGPVPLETRVFSLRGLLDELRGLFLAESIRSDNTIETACGDHVGDWFEGDDGKIKSIACNFISNALKYAPGTRVTVSADELDGDSEHAEIIIEVADEGSGVPLVEQGLIFKKFVRGTKAKSQKTTGAGLGLAVCHALARAMDGSVGVESPRGGGGMRGPGAVFFLQLKLKRAKAAERERQPAAKPEEVARESAPRAASALVVDDQPYNQVALAGVAEQLGFATACVPSGEAALAEAAKRRPALVLLDHGLPGLSGAQTAARLRALTDGAGIVILGVSAHARPGMEAQALKDGMDGFLPKPVTRESLAGAISRANARRGLDLSALESHSRKNACSLAEAAKAWGDELRGIMDELRRAVASGDRPAIAKNAHRINSHATLIRAESLRAAADGWETKLERETAGLSADAGAYAWNETFARLEREAEQTLRMLDERLQQARVVQTNPHSWTQ